MLWRTPSKWRMVGLVALVSWSHQVILTHVLEESAAAGGDAHANGHLDRLWSRFFQLSTWDHLLLGNTGAFWMLPVAYVVVGHGVAFVLVWLLEALVGGVAYLTWALWSRREEVRRRLLQDPELNPALYADDARRREPETIIMYR